MEGLASQHIKSFRYTDNTSDQADDLSITLADPDRTWMQKYLPQTKKGLECTAAMKVESWTNPSDTREFDCGIFFINSVGFKGPPNEVDIKASSIPPNGVKSTSKFKAWENMDLKGIAGQIAEQNDLTLFYDASDNPRTKRTDQADKSDLEYLRDRCKEAKLSLKIHKKQLIIYSEEEYESREPAFTLEYGKSNILDWSFSSTNEDTFDEAKNSFIDPDTGLVVEDGFKPGKSPEGTKAKLMLNEGIEMEPDDPDPDVREFTGPILRIDEIKTDWDTGTPAANAKKKGKGKGGRKNAARKAKAKLREKNKKENKCSINVHGNIDYLSGLTCKLEGFGQMFDIKWFIESSAHEISGSGYTTGLSLRGALEGY